MITKAEIDAIKWYHEIEVDPGIVTTPDARFWVSWDLIEQNFPNVSGKSVLDVGTRDGKYAFMAEKRGASKVLAVDNNQSQGALLLAKHWNSKVKFEEVNLYHMRPETHGKFDVILFYGVLYHLRYPMFALKILSDLLNDGGKMFIEAGILNDRNELPLLFCPTRNSPYEQTSCTFFNIKGLEETMLSFGLRMDNHKIHPQEPAGLVRRAWFEATKTGTMGESLAKYWETIHHSHS